MAKHTETPWRFERAPAGPLRILSNPNRILATVTISHMDDHEANAAHIVRCVNSHDALLAALEAMVAQAELASEWRLRHGTEIINARAALDEARK